MSLKEDTKTMGILRVERATIEPFNLLMTDISLKKLSQLIAMPY